MASEIYGSVAQDHGKRLVGGDGERKIRDSCNKKSSGNSRTKTSSQESIACPTNKNNRIYSFEQYHFSMPSFHPWYDILDNEISAETEVCTAQKGARIVSILEEVVGRTYEGSRENGKFLADNESFG
eukprot:CAMPEP_0116010582 /NCGR_PEP_ID=MMETSP0321-20121206/4080_1 /TAXON_ID=163516 /ORGANISM="Leptocylindrus danicus var. danicus, Strain B650" /LENGTH=126 /DNA_ID=CAMNT_0003479695 /DNA_START=190 /DNA_END=573 /DNA_ORIENTATION=+